MRVKETSPMVKKATDGSAKRGTTTKGKVKGKMIERGRAKEEIVWGKEEKKGRGQGRPDMKQL